MYTLEQRLQAKEVFHQMQSVSDPLHKYPMCFETARLCSINAVNLVIMTLGTKYIGGNQNAFDFWMGVRDYLISITYEKLINENL